MEVRGVFEFDIQYFTKAKKNVKKGVESYPHTFDVNKYFIFAVRCIK
jgi:hypothetical protein